MSRRDARVTGRLVRQAARGDQRSFERLVLQYDGGLRALAYRLLNDRELMDDVLQEAYVKAYRSLPRFRGEASAGTWLYRIVYNACIDALRRRRPAEVQLEDRHVEPDVTDPAEVAVIRADLEAALRGLSPDQRAVVLLVDAQGFDYASAAEVLGVPPGTVGSRLSHARRELRRALGVRDQGVSD